MENGKIENSGTSEERPLSAKMQAIKDQKICMTCRYRMPPHTMLALQIPPPPGKIQQVNKPETLFLTICGNQDSQDFQRVSTAHNSCLFWQPREIIAAPTVLPFPEKDSKNRR